MLVPRAFELKLLLYSQMRERKKNKKIKLQERSKLIHSMHFADTNKQLLHNVGVDIVMHY
jgi:hypothetical protein